MGLLLDAEVWHGPSWRPRLADAGGTRSSTGPRARLTTRPWNPDGPTATYCNRILRAPSSLLPETAMFERFSRSWGLIKASAGVLSKDKELLVFPLLSAVCTLIVAAAFVLPAIGMGALDGLRRGRRHVADGLRARVPVLPGAVLRDLLLQLRAGGRGDDPAGRRRPDPGATACASPAARSCRSSATPPSPRPWA